MISDLFMSTTRKNVRDVHRAKNDPNPLTPTDAILVHKPIKHPVPNWAKS